MKQTLLTSVVATCLFIAGAANAAVNSVATVTFVKGQVIVENAEGVRQFAKANMTLAEGSNVIVLENGKVDLQYQASQCKISHGKNSLLSVSDKAQCAASKQISVGQAGKKSVVYGDPAVAAGVSSKVGGLVFPPPPPALSPKLLLALVGGTTFMPSIGKTNNLEHCYDKNGPEPSCPNYVKTK